MGKRSSVRITKRLVEGLPAQSALWDSEVTGFGVRRQSGRATYVLKCTVRRRRYYITIGKHGAPWTTEEARSHAKLILYSLHKGEPIPSLLDEGTLTVEALCARYLAEHAPRKKVSSRRSDERLIANHVIPLLGSKELAGLTKQDIEKFQRAVRDGATAPTNPRAVQLRQRGGLPVRGGPGVANRCLTLLSKMLNLAEEWELRPANSNPVKRIKKYPERKRERFLNDAELVRLGLALAEVPLNSFAKAAIILLIYTGARLGEILHLRWSWVDLQRGLLLLPDSKTGQKSIRLPRPAVDILASLPRYQENPYVIVGSRAGQHLVNLQTSWKRLCRAAGLSGLRLHDLRHTYASLAIAEGLSLAITGALLSHASTKTTERYAHLQNDHIKAASDRVGERIRLLLSGG